MRLWTLVFAAGAGIASLLSVILKVDYAAWGITLSAMGLAGFFSFLLLAKPDRLRPADYVSFLRIIIAIAALIVLSLGIFREGSIFIFSILVVGGISDFFDGAIARKTGSTAFGQILDPEADAYFILALAFAAHHIVGIGSWILIAGLLRYGYVFFFPNEFSTDSKLFRYYAKAACAYTEVVLVGAFAPFADLRIKTILSIAAVGLLSLSFIIETILRLRQAPAKASGLTTLVGLVKSFLIYYGVPFRKRGIQRLYSTFIKPGDLCFDIGSHLGNRIRALKGIGAEVLAVEPHPACFRFVERIYGGKRGITLLNLAVGSEAGRKKLNICVSNPTLSTLSESWINQVKKSKSFDRIEWTESIEVEVTTLDKIIREYGVPGFIKIDVEGFEEEVLKGLSYPANALSFEFLPASIETALACVNRTASLSRYKFNLSRVETMKFVWDEWREHEEVIKYLAGLSREDRSGDVYALLQHTDTVK
jgi:FkbM family methyltransferase